MNTTQTAAPHYSYSTKRRNIKGTCGSRLNCPTFSSVAEKGVSWEVAPTWQSLCRLTHTTRPPLPPLTFQEILHRFPTEADLTRDDMAWVCDVLEQGRSHHFHPANWQPATLFPWLSKRPLWGVIVGSHEHPIMRMFTQVNRASQFATDMERWRIEGGTTDTRHTLMVPPYQAMSYYLHCKTARAGQLRMTLPQYTGSDTFQQLHPRDLHGYEKRGMYYTDNDRLRQPQP